MKTNFIIVNMLLLILVLSACSPLTLVEASGAPATPVTQSGYQPVTVDHVGIQAGEGSPIPVEIIASGTWPDLCSQVASMESKMDGFNIEITVLASTTDTCPPDRLGLPFRFAIPLNIVEMKAGTYTITVNGTSTSFQLPLSP